jgi:uncharacterized protein (DUF1778 family)
MPAARSPISRTHAVNLRVRDDVRSLIDRAAGALGKTRTDFILEAASHAANEALLDQTRVRVDRETYEKFVAVLDQPPSGKGFARLINAPKPWRK